MWQYYFLLSPWSCPRAPLCPLVPKAMISELEEILEWAAVPSSHRDQINAGMYPALLAHSLPTGPPRKPILEACAWGLSHFSYVWFFVTLWLVDCHAPLPMGFPRQEYLSVLPVPSPGHLPNSGVEPKSSALQGSPWKFYIGAHNWSLFIFPHWLPPCPLKI